MNGETRNGKIRRLIIDNDVLGMPQVVGYKTRELAAFSLVGIGEDANVIHARFGPEKMRGRKCADDEQTAAHRSNENKISHR